jgi:preprotein translocase subunit SecY
MLGAVPEEKQTLGASRYDAIVATFIALLAVCVSGYTAYMQRQQVRVAVWKAKTQNSLSSLFPWRLSGFSQITIASSRLLAPVCPNPFVYDQECHSQIAPNQRRRTLSPARWPR